MEKWKSCQHLWKNDLTKIIENLKDKAPSHAKFEAKITGYTRAATKVLSEAGNVDIDWIRIDNRMLVHSVYNESVELTTAVSTAMQEIDMSALASETSRVLRLKEVINKEPESLEVCLTYSLALLAVRNSPHPVCVMLSSRTGPLCCLFFLALLTCTSLFSAFLLLILAVLMLLLGVNEG